MTEPCSRKKGAESFGFYLPPFLLGGESVADDLSITSSKLGCKETSFIGMLLLGKA